MNRVACAALLSTFLALSAAGQSVNWSQGVVYEYDGSGNVKKIGTDTYVYDTGQRLIRGSVAGSQQSYTYDSFGNRTGCQSGAGADCQYGLTIVTSTNRVAGRTYDRRGNMAQLPENNTLDYDELGMVRKEIGTWRFTVRGLDKKPLREFTSESALGTANFKWTKDQIWRDSILLASRQLDPTASGGVSTYHYHVDHLGTPRQVTTSAAIIVGRHDYLPFGPEVSGNPSEPQPQTLKFTGHERDFVRDRPPLDYMHARYYEPRLGRFLSVDPGGWDKFRPQTWNRYAYAENNPVLKVDPDGRQATVPFPGVGPMPPVGPALYHAQQMRTNPSYRQAAVGAVRKLQAVSLGFLVGVLAVSRPFIVTPSGTILPGGKDVNLVPTATGTGGWLQIHDSHSHDGAQPHTHRPETTVGPNGEVDVNRTDKPTTAEDIDEADRRAKDGELRPRTDRKDKGDREPKPRPKKQEEELKVQR